MIVIEYNDSKQYNGQVKNKKRKAHFCHKMIKVKEFGKRILSTNID